MMFLKKGYSLLLILLFAASLVQSQNYNTITGKIVDNATNEPLTGATISVEGSLRGTIADFNGEFFIGRIKEERVVLIIQFISYTDQRIACDFSTSPSLNKTIRMHYSATELEEIEIRGKSQGQVQAMLKQKNAMNIKNVVSSEQIEEFPDMNAAEVIQRIPGITLQRDQGEGRYVQLRGTPPELTNFNINGEQIPSPEGDVRYVGLDVISADQIDFIEVTKVLTPDMDGDGIAGNVNIITKSATSEKLETKVSLSGGYNNIRSTNNYQGQLSLGKRIGIFGFYINGSYFKNNQGADNMEYEYIKSTLSNSASQETGVNNHYIQFKEVQLRHYTIARERIGLSTSFDLKFNENSMLYVRGMYNNFSDDETRRRLVYDLDDAFVESYYTYSQIEHDIKDRTKNQNISTLNIGGENKISNVTLDYEAAYSLASENEPDRFESTFKNPGHGIDIKFDLKEPNWPRVTFPYGPDSADIYSYDEYNLDQLLFEKAFVTDKNSTVKLNIRIPYHIGKYNNGYVKTGGKIRFKNKERDAEASSFSRYVRRTRENPNVFGPEMSLTDIEDDFYVNNFLNKNYYELNHMPSPDKLTNFYHEYPHLFITDINDSTERTFSEDYQAKENIYAAYAMIRHDIGKLMILGGVRYEITDISYTTTNIFYNNHDNYEGMADTSDRRTFSMFLPMVQLKYALNNTFNIRAAITKSYARPNFEDVLPVESREKRKVKFGNPDLNYPVSLNIDFLAEKYIQGDGLLSGGFFYKKIDNFVFNYSRYARFGTFTRNGEIIGDASSGGAPITGTMPLNGIDAHVYGGEILSQFMFSFLPGFLKNFGIYFNYTYTLSEAKIKKRIPGNLVHDIVIVGAESDTLQLFSSTDDIEVIQLPGQAKHALNIALYFETKTIYTKFSANYHDAFLNDLGLDKDLDEYYNDAWHFDFTANYSITKNIKLFTDIINLTNSPLVFYLGTPDRFYKREFYSWWGRIGVKFNF